MQDSLERLRLRLAQLQAAQVRLSSGRVVQRPSDDPGRMGSILALRDLQRAREQQVRNAQDGATWVALADSKLRSAAEGLRRARELAVRAASTSSPTERAAVAAELLSIRDDLVAIANARNGGQGLFAGTATAPAVTNVGGVWTYTGDATRVVRRVGDGEDVVVSVTADEIFGLGTGADTFTMLENLASLVTSGDAAGVGAAIADLDAALGRVLDGLAEIGAAGNRIERAQARLGDEQVALTSQLSEVQDADLAEAVMELQLQQVAYQATLGAMTQVLQPSLVDFLR
ncbi:MAG: flagellar hook-associated protein FlgL [Actinomycetota bacterium]|nr:MAG: flagellar hook-associated protein FlgL [Actinomycetota bacterium]